MTETLTVNQAIERARQLNGCIEDVIVRGYFVYDFERIELVHHVKAEWNPKSTHYPPQHCYATESKLYGNAIWLNLPTGFIKNYQDGRAKSGSIVLVQGRLEVTTLISEKPSWLWRWLRILLIPNFLQRKYYGLGHLSAYQAELHVEKFIIE